MRAAGQRSYNSAACTARQWLRGVVIIIAAGFLLSCSSPLANLPEYGQTAGKDFEQQPATNQDQPNGR